MLSIDIVPEIEEFNFDPSGNVIAIGCVFLLILDSNDWWELGR